MNVVMQTAQLSILYEETPITPGDRFIQIRRWEAVIDECVELVVEYGHLDENGELYTQCQTMPFFMSIQDVLLSVGR